MNSPTRLPIPPSPFRPALARGAAPEGRRVPGPLRGPRDPRLERGLASVSRAWELAKSEYVDDAVAQHTSADFSRVVSGTIARVLMPIGVIGPRDLGSAQDLELGLRSLPGASIGVGAGAPMALDLIEQLGTGFLIGKLVEHVGAVDRVFEAGIREAWESQGSRIGVDSAARVMADATGIFFSLFLQGFVAFLADELAGPAKGRLRPILAPLKEQRLFRESEGLHEWLLRNYDRSRVEFSAKDVGLTLSRGGIPRIRPDAGLPDVSRLYQFREYVSDGKTHKQGSGPLGVPGRVQTHRSQSAQRGVSSGTGDDAGHLIGDRFGAPGGSENLSPQNWIANRYGTYKGLEDSWAKKLLDGVDIEVNVTDVTRAGEDRPFMREVRWTELGPDDRRSSHNLTFANTHTPKSREARDIAPTPTATGGGQVIEVDFKNKTRPS